MIARPTITKVEFIGGPEDGRILELADYPAMVMSPEAEDDGKVPMLLTLDTVDTLEDGDELEVLILGYYVSSRTAGNCAKFEWVPLP